MCRGPFGFELSYPNGKVVDGGGAADFCNEFVAHIGKLVFEFFKSGIDLVESAIDSVQTFVNSVEALIHVGAELLLLFLQSINPGSQLAKLRRYEVLHSRSNILCDAHDRVPSRCDAFKNNKSRRQPKPY